MEELRRFRGLRTEERLGVEAVVASSFVSRLLGLARLPPELAPAALLIPRCAAVHTFGMRFDIDVLFLDRHGRVIEARRALPPRRLVRCRGAAAVLEIPRGRG